MAHHAEGSRSTVVVAPHEFDAHYVAAALGMVVWRLRSSGLGTVVWQLRSSELDMAVAWQHFALDMVALLQPVLPVGYYSRSIRWDANWPSGLQGQTGPVLVFADNCCNSSFQGYCTK